MVVGVLGEVVANLVDLEERQDHAQILDQQMEDPDVLDRQVELVTLKDAVVMIFYFFIRIYHLPSKCDPVQIWSLQTIHPKDVTLLLGWISS